MSNLYTANFSFHLANKITSISCNGRYCLFFIIFFAVITKTAYDGIILSLNELFFNVIQIYIIIE